MQPNNDENDVYIIPPNFIDTGTVLGGSVKLRNAVEALGLVLMIGFPVFHLPFSLTTRIIIACITVLPAALFAIIGIGGETDILHQLRFFHYIYSQCISPFSFQHIYICKIIFNFFKY